MTEFGTMADFDHMLAGMKARGIRLVIDLVVNPTSDRHPWFENAKQGPDSRYRDYYIWRPECTYADGLRVHEYLRELNRTVLSKYDAMTVGEEWRVIAANGPLFTDARRGDLNMVFQFDIFKSRT